MKDAVERLRAKAQNEATVFALRDFCNDQEKELQRLRKKPCGMHQSKGNSNVWATTNCGEIMSGIKLTDWSWNYCPYCGGELKK